MQSSEQPLVSVIIASYNHADYIEASIHSVLAQTYPNIELLVIDDGSKDDSVERIRHIDAAAIRERFAAFSALTRFDAPKL